MPKITITYTHEELVAFVTGMLAVQGLHPVTDIQFVSLDSDLNRFNVVIDCEPGPLSEKCPSCGVKLTNGVPVPVAIVAVPHEGSVVSLRSTEKTAAAPPREYPVDEETQEVQDPVVIDEELGESFAPPSPGEGVPSVHVSTAEEPEESGGSMKALLEKNKHLTAVRTREREATLGKRGGRRMPGESTRPPKPGRES
jgi:hypothetical protein